MKSLFFALFLALVVPSNGQSPIDSVRTGQGGIQGLADSLASSMTSTQNQQTQTQTRKIKIIKKDIPYGAFITIALGMMAFIALIMTTPQTYNPSE
jgi:hypothetical protein